MIARADQCIRVVIPGDPVAQGRGRAIPTARGIRVKDPEKARAWKRSAAIYMRLAMRSRQPLDGPLRCEVLFVFMRAKPRRLRLWKSTKPDLDNLCKAAWDAANGVLWHDDGQVVEAHARKVWGASDEEARVEIDVMPVGEV